MDHQAIKMEEANMEYAHNTAYKWKGKLQIMSSMIYAVHVYVCLCKF